MDSDEFDKYIEYDGDSDNSGKENRKVIPNRQAKVTDQQLDKILVFMRDHNEGLIEKSTRNLLWQNLAIELNDIGPPDHTVAEWKKIWSQNKKRKLSSSSLCAEKPLKASKIDQSLHPSSIAENGTCKDCHSVLIQKFDVLIEAQKELIRKTDTTNILLQEIANKLSGT